MSQVIVNVNNSNNNYSRPAFQHPTSRGLIKLIIFSFLTFGIYPLVAYSKVSSEINIVASRHDGRHTMHYCLLFFIVSPLTLGIGSLVWYNNICNRMGSELYRRNINYRIGAGTFWGWAILGSFLFGIGSLVFIHKFFKAMNLINADYNING